MTTYSDVILPYVSGLVLSCLVEFLGLGIQSEVSASCPGVSDSVSRRCSQEIGSSTHNGSSTRAGRLRPKGAKISTKSGT